MWPACSRTHSIFVIIFYDNYKTLAADKPIFDALEVEKADNTSFSSYSLSPPENVDVLVSIPGSDSNQTLADLQKKIDHAVADERPDIHWHKLLEHLDKLELTILRSGRMRNVIVNLQKQEMSLPNSLLYRHNDGHQGWKTEFLNQTDQFNLANCFFASQELPASFNFCPSIEGSLIVSKEEMSLYAVKMVNGSRDYFLKSVRSQQSLHRPFVSNAASNLNQHARRKRQAWAADHWIEKFSQTRYINLYVVVDPMAATVLCMFPSGCIGKVMSILNYVNVLFLPLNIRVVLSAIEIWDRSALFGDINTLNSNYAREFTQYIMARAINDTAMQNAELRVAFSVPFGEDQKYSGRIHNQDMCSTRSSAIVDITGSVPVSALTLAHELGHMLGAKHDTGECLTCDYVNTNRSECIMISSASERYFYDPDEPKMWSTCSIEAIYKSLSGPYWQCLNDKPAMDTYNISCGNYIVETNEECDEGGTNTLHPCCSQNCKLWMGNEQCVRGECCEISMCSVKQAGEACRGDCGMTDGMTCDGIHSQCTVHRDFPASTVLYPNCANMPSKIKIVLTIDQGNRTLSRKYHHCNNSGPGYCIDGDCNTHNSQCKLLWGDDAIAGDDACYQQNMQIGNRSGNCGHIVNNLGHIEEYITCSNSSNIFCGLLHCQVSPWNVNWTMIENEWLDPPLLRYIDNHVCVSAMFKKGLKNFVYRDPGLVPNGASCGPHNVCDRGMCIDARAIDECADSPCVHGVCVDGYMEFTCTCDPGFTGHTCDAECWTGSPKGTDYTGTVNRTAGGLECQRWDSNYPINHNFLNRPDLFPDQTVSQAENYCRNPSGELLGGPWCYTKDPAIRWRYCNVSQCDDNCYYRSNQGRGYKGKVHRTVGGLECQRWDRNNNPHRFGFTVRPILFPDQTVSEAENYCRNPDNSGAPWCYTIDPAVRWGYCRVPVCAVATTTPRQIRLVHDGNEWVHHTYPTSSATESTITTTTTSTTTPVRPTPPLTDMGNWSENVQIPTTTVDTPERIYFDVPVQEQGLEEDEDNPTAKPIALKRYLLLAGIAIGAAAAAVVLLTTWSYRQETMTAAN